MLWKRACLGAFAVLLMTAGVVEAQQQTRIITGTITEAVTNDVVVGATVIIKGTQNGAFSEPDGSFTVTDAPLGDVVLEVSSVSHKTAEIVVPSGRSSQIKIELVLDEGEVINVTGRAPELFRKNLNNGASTVRGDALNEVPPSTIGTGLQGKVAGANIQSNSGAPGGGIQIAMRGVSTIAGRTDILYVVDGVIVSDAAISSGINAVTGSAGGSNASNQDNPVNRIADLNPNDIENIEILKGASAAALYGSKASNGVVVITTKRGRVGKPKVTITQRVGTAHVLNTFGSRVWRNEAEVLEAFGPEIGPFQTADLFVEDGSGGYVQHDHERAIMRQTFSTETAASLSGGTETTRYLVSALVRDEPGIMIGSGYQKQSARVAVDQKFGDRLTVSATSNFIHSRTSRGMTNNDNNSVSHYMVLSFTPNFIDLRQYEDGSYPINPFVGSGTNPLQTVTLMRDAEDVWRNISSLSANLTVLKNDEHKLTLTGIAGIDRFQSRNSLLFPRELIFEPNDGLAGTAIAVTGENRRLNWGLSLIHNYEPKSKAFKSAASVGVYYDENRLNILRVFSQGLSAGPGTIDTGASINTTDTRILERDQSISVQEELLLLDDRLSILAAVLADRSSNNGDPNKFFLFPKASAAYRIPLPSVPQISLLRARLAYGETGNKPSFGQIFTNLGQTGTVSGQNGIGLGGVAGNPDLVPERQREIEAGIDLSAYEGRVVTEMTFYQRNISDLILPVTLAPSTGFTSKIDNIASLRNTGVELMLQVTPIRTNNFQWLSRNIYYKNVSTITDLDVPAFRIGGFGVSLGAFWIEEGKSATQIVGNGVDADGNVSQVVVGDATPDFRMSFVNDFTWGNFTFHSLLDWQQGSSVINLTRLLYDFGQNTPDFVDANGEGTEGTGAWRLDQWQNGNTSVYIEDGSFLKVRELSVTYKLPKRLVKMLGPMDDANINLAGRNLFMFTNYTGVDPEVSNFGRQSIARNIDVAPYPPNRSFWLSVSATF